MAPTELRELLAAPVLEVAPRLLGGVLRVESTDGTVGVRLTEVEAYAGEADPGSHAFRGLTPRTAVMFGPAGYLYVYFTYGMHWCVNIVTGVEGAASAVLLRAGEVVEGVELARTRRPAAKRDVELARGPARLASALGVDSTLYGTDVLGDGPVTFAPADEPTQGVRTGPRVGVAGPGGSAETHPWRFWIDADPTVSVYRAAQPRKRRT